MRSIRPTTTARHSRDRRWGRRWLHLAVLLGALLIGDRAAAQVVIDGAGASFSTRLIEAWASAFHRDNGDVIVSFRPIGSARGVALFLGDTIDFAVSDTPLTPEQRRETPMGVVELPLAAGALVLAFNVRGVDTLNLSGEIVAGIFLGEINTWDDPRIQRLNPDVVLPAMTIVPVHRSEGSGSTFAFTRYLAAESEAWRRGPGIGQTIRWPTGPGSLGTSGLLLTVQKTPGAIGYVDFGRARSAEEPIGIAALGDDDGPFISPNSDTIRAGLLALDGADNDPTAQVYPIVIVTRFVAHRDYGNASLAAAIRRFVRFGLARPADDNATLGFVDLPGDMRSQTEAMIADIGPQ
ncbi:phosphate ABC transporter substrate-binding protein PstS [Bauldia sp.]|uniref:phosphate ABC transporter substrate-binding protein PstS n=1 Tax=Bauldia sp. TaxID=2575872 RepID=UPI003BACC23C